MAAVFSADELVVLVAAVDRELVGLGAPPAIGRDAMDELRALKLMLASQTTSIEQTLGNQRIVFCGGLRGWRSGMSVRKGVC